MLHQALGFALMLGHYLERDGVGWKERFAKPTVTSLLIFPLGPVDSPAVYSCFQLRRHHQLRL